MDFSLLANKFFILTGFTAILFCSCNRINREHFKLYSPDKKQCVTFITESKIRYVINGNHNSVPSYGYVKIDISEIDPIGDEIGICWQNEEYEWEIANHKSRIIENKLNTLKYKFNTSWERDDRGIPNAKKYIQPSCETLDLLRMEFLPNTGKAILEN